jgi:hypothetical protein
MICFLKQGLKAGSYMLYGQVGTDAASGVILTADALEQIEAVKHPPQTHRPTKSQSDC